MSRKNEIPRSPRRSQISKRAYELLTEIGADRLPINIDDILEAYPDIILVPFTEFKEYRGDDIPDSLNFDKINARIDKETSVCLNIYSLAPEI